VAGVPETLHHSWVNPALKDGAQPPTPPSRYYKHDAIFTAAPVVCHCNKKVLKGFW